MDGQIPTTHIYPGLAVGRFYGRVLPAYLQLALEQENSKLRQKKVLSKRELEVEKILQELLPEYIIRANVRLADVIHAGRQFKWMSGYHLDFVICNAQADVIAAVELDDSTHDTDDGRRRDTNKNRWLCEANIKLIRIRSIEEAKTIRELLAKPINNPLSSFHTLSMPEASDATLRSSGWQKTVSIFNAKPRNRNSHRMVFSIIAMLFLIWGINFAVSKYVSRVTERASLFQKHAGQSQPQTISQQEIFRRQQAEQVWKQQQERELAMVRAKIAAEKPHYERRLVKGKSARECANGNVISNETIICTQDHYETVWVEGH